MTLKKFVLIPVIIGVLACLIQALDQLLYSSVPPEGNVGFSWISFQSWAVYFLAGCTVRGGIKALLRMRSVLLLLLLLWFLVVR